MCIRDSSPPPLPDAYLGALGVSVASVHGAGADGDDGGWAGISSHTQLAGVFAGVVFAMMLAALSLIALATAHAAEQAARGTGAADEDEVARQRLAAQVLALPAARVAELRAEVERQARLAKMATAAGGGGKPAGGGRARASAAAWAVHRAPDGTRYYVHAETGTATWEMPQELRSHMAWDHRKSAAEIAVPPDFE